MSRLFLQQKMARYNLQAEHKPRIHVDKNNECKSSRRFFFILQGTLSTHPKPKLQHQRNIGQKQTLLTVQFILKNHIHDIISIQNSLNHSSDGTWGKHDRRRRRRRKYVYFTRRASRQAWLQASVWIATCQITMVVVVVGVGVREGEWQPY